jgi:YidC/Oxa1 family membrane protein insertase
MPRDGDAERLMPDDFEPDEFEGEGFAKGPLNPRGEWFLGSRNPAFAAVSNAYFAHALAPLDDGTSPACLLQIEERWDSTRYESKGQDPNAGAMYRARLAYPATTLQPGAKATYRTLTYIGPKERVVLADAGDGQHRLDELINLGFFAAIAKVLVKFLLLVQGVTHNWGLAIIVLTLTARTLLFPLSLPGIRNMIRMREIKPEMDALNEKFKDDPQQRGLAQMELWRKHNVNPFKGCVPQLASMPVWFALYTTLQTAVELYHIPFLWFPDLSKPDPLFILPFVIGGTFFLQQTLMPMQGGDPAQQKMMKYFMPGMFTVMMLFLPAGLGVYMFTNSLLAITQQHLVERHARRAVTTTGGAQIEVRDADPSSTEATSGKKRNKKKR